MAIAIEGSVYNTSFGNTSFSLPQFTTTQPTIIVAAITVNNASVLSVTDTSAVAVWGTTPRVTAAGSGGSLRCELWYAKADSSFTSNVITINMNAASDYAVGSIFAVSGLNGLNFDSNGSLPAAAQDASSPLVVSTSQADDIIIGIYRQANSNPTAGAGFTMISGADFMLVEYKIVSSVQANLTVPLGSFSGTLNTEIADALSSYIFVPKRHVSGGGITFS